jgi:GNAT superfamily N-acetyltransferase
VAEIDNIVIGFIQYIPSKNKKFEDYGEIQALYILDEYHGNGIGTKLFNLAILELREMGFQSIIIDCLVANSANNFYLKMGTTINSVKEELFMGGILLENIHTFNI